MAKKELKLDFTTKDIINIFISRKEQILQAVILELQCWVGDWFLDGNNGIPYDIRLENKSMLLSDIQDKILSVDGVASVKDLNIKITYDGMNKTRKVFNITGTLNLNTGESAILNGLVPIVIR